MEFWLGFLIGIAFCIVAYEIILPYFKKPKKPNDKKPPDKP